MAEVVAFVEDLMFASRIREAAQRQGVTVATARTPEALLEACRAGARVVLLDLDARRLPTLDALGALAAEPSLAGRRIVGFFSHVDAARAREAQAAGCTEVLPRSAFVQRLDAIVRSGDGGEPSPGA